MYWGQGEVDAKEKDGLELRSNGHSYPSKSEEKERTYEPAPWQEQHATRRVATPPPASGGRKWARKVD